MNLKRICYLTLVGLLLKGGHNVVQAATFDDSDRPIAIMEDSNGTSMESFYLGEGITIFFHPETKEFQCTAIALDTNLEEYQNLNYENSKDIENFILQEVKDLFGEDSTEYQTLTKRITENSQIKNTRSTLTFSRWAIAPRSTRTDGQSLYVANNGAITVKGSLASLRNNTQENVQEPRSSLTIGLVQANGTHTSYLNSSASFTHYFSQLPAGNWSLRITNNYSVSQYFTGSMYN